jgi:hypothetical protein
VITGELDYRCPYTQSLGYFTALQKRGVPSRLIVYPESRPLAELARDGLLLQRAPRLGSAMYLGGRPSLRTT